MIVVVSHDCDVVNPDLMKEPWVEVAQAMAAPPNEQPDGNLTYGKSPRELQIRSVASGIASTYVLRADERWQFPRTTLQTARPASFLESESIEILGKWLGRRYDRAALPSTFVERTRNASRVIEREMKRTVEAVAALLVSLSSEAELPPSTSYQVNLVALMRESDYLDPARRAAVTTAITTVEASLAECEGIEVGSVEVVSEAEMSLAEYRSYVRWEYDYLSHRLGPRGRTAPRV
jgi:hypothetical protein